MLAVPSPSCVTCSCYSKRRVLTWFDWKCASSQVHVELSLFLLYACHKHRLHVAVTYFPLTRASGRDFLLEYQAANRFSRKLNLWLISQSDQMGNVQSTPMLRILLRKSRFKTQGRFSFLLPWLVISSFVQFSEEDFGSLTVCASKISCSTHTYACHGVCTWKIIPKSDILPWLLLFFEDLTGASLKMKPCYSSFQKEYLFSLLLCQANHVWDFLTPYIYFFKMHTHQF